METPGLLCCGRSLTLRYCPLSVEQFLLRLRPSQQIFSCRKVFLNRVLFGNTSITVLVWTHISSSSSLRVSYYLFYLKQHKKPNIFLFFVIFNSLFCVFHKNNELNQHFVIDLKVSKKIFSTFLIVRASLKTIIFGSKITEKLWVSIYRYALEGQSNMAVVSSVDWAMRVLQHVQFRARDCAYLLLSTKLKPIKSSATACWQSVMRLQLRAPTLSSHVYCYCERHENKITIKLPLIFSVTRRGNTVVLGWGGGVGGCYSWRSNYHCLLSRRLLESNAYIEYSNDHNY